MTPYERFIMPDLRHPKSVTLEVTINLDPVPGSFHTVESAQEQVQAMLNSMVPHYKPTVAIKYPLP